MNRTYFAGAAWAVCAILFASGSGLAAGKMIEARADQYLKEMGDYLANLKAFSLQVDETFDEIQDNGQKLQYGNRRTITVQRPNRLKGNANGDTLHREFFYDGKSITLFDPVKKAYGRIKAPDTIPAMLDEIHDKLGQSQPLADFLFPNPYHVLTERVQSGKYVGLHHVGTVKCHHLAFRQKNLDWQIWIAAGDKPLPRKMVITFKREAGGPQYTARMSKWDANPKVGSDTFEFKPPEGARKVDLASLAGSTEPGKESDKE